MTTCQVDCTLEGNARICQAARGYPTLIYYKADKQYSYRVRMMLLPIGISCAGSTHGGGVRCVCAGRI